LPDSRPRNVNDQGVASNPPVRAQLAEVSVPIKSKAQRRKFAELLVEGKISPETFEEWNRKARRNCPSGFTRRVQNARRNRSALARLRPQRQAEGVGLRESTNGSILSPRFLDTHFCGKSQGVKIENQRSRRRNGEPSSINGCR
jgi:hypothetical protein